MGQFKNSTWIRQRDRSVLSHQTFAYASVCVCVGFIGSISLAGGIPPVHLTWQIDDLSSVSINVVGIEAGDGAIYIGGWIDKASGIQMQWTVFGDGDYMDGFGQITNDLTVTNLTNETKAVDISMHLPVNTPFIAASISGEVGFQITADSNGAFFTNNEVMPVWTAQVDNQIVNQMFFPPMYVDLPPFGMATVHEQPFDATIPANGVMVNDTVSYKFQFSLTPGDSVTFLGGFVIDAAPPIPGDTNADGIVDSEDLLAVLAAWGDCAGSCWPVCAEDVDNNCVVDVRDLLFILQNWT